MDKLLSAVGDAATFVAIMLMVAAGFVVMIFQAIWAWGLIAQLVLMGLVLWASFCFLRACLGGSNVAAGTCLATMVMWSLYVIYTHHDGPCNDGVPNVDIVYMVCLGEDTGTAVVEPIET